MIEILVAFIQAFIFTTLTAVFIGQAFEGEHAHGDDHAAAHHHRPQHQPQPPEAGQPLDDRRALLVVPFRDRW